MERIEKAIQKDIAEIKRIMDIGLATTQDKTWYVTDEVDFLEQHIGKEGYILKYMVGEVIAGFLLVRHPGLAEDNLGKYLAEQNNSSETKNLVLPDGWLHRITHMESASVLPEYRGRGIQQKLLQRAEELEKEWGAEYLMCTVHPDNVYSATNLERLGYITLLETEKYGGLKRKIMYKAI